MTHDEFRKLAETANYSAFVGDWPSKENLLAKGIPEIDAAYIAAANPKTVLELLDEIADLKTSVVAFAGVFAVEHAKLLGLPKDHLYSHHYDLLEKCGARMVDFKRYEAKP